MKKALIALLIAILGVLTGTQVANLGAETTGVATAAATTSTATVSGGGVTQLFSESPRCDSRIISTAGEPITLSFGSTSPFGGAQATSTLQQGKGHLQAASTTVAYDSGIYGCGIWIARGNNATTTINLTETR